MKIFISILILSIFSLTSHSAQLPSSWTGIEVQNGNDPDDVEVEDKVKHLFSMQRDVLEKANINQVRTAGAWGIRNFILDLGVSHSGTLGYLPFDGTAAATAFWGMAGNKTIPNKDGVFELKMNPSMSLQDLDEQSQFLTETMVATGKIKNKKRFGKEVKKLMHEFYVIAHTLAGSYNPGWRVKTLYFERSVSGSGFILRQIFGSTRVRFRVAWDLQNKAVGDLPPKLEEKRDKIFDDIQNLVTDLANDLHFAASQLSEKAQANVRTFTVGLGIEDKFNLIGLVKARDEGMGLIEFEYFKDEDFVPSINSDESRIRFMSGEQVDRDNLREGLEQALKISTKLYDFASQEKGKNWELQRLDVSFEMGAGKTIKKSWVSKVKGKSTSIISLGPKL